MIDIWNDWLAAYGGAEYFLLAMIVFLGSYALVTLRFATMHQGTRRALALAFLAAGLWIGHWASQASTPSPAPPPLYPPTSYPPTPPSPIPIEEPPAGLWLTSLLAALVTAGAAYGATYSWGQGTRWGLAGLVGLLFYHLAPPLTFPALVVWAGLMGWAAYALHRRQSMHRG